MTAFGKQLNEWSVTARLYELIEDMSEDEQLTLLKESEERLSNGKRKHERKPFFMVVDYSAEDRLYKDYIQNISVGGVFIETRMPFRAGQEVSLCLPLPNYQKYIKITGEVLRISPQGIGVKFKMVNEDQEAIIKSLLQMI
jgi:Tfp pilus assembly protein PilZ